MCNKQPDTFLHLDVRVHGVLFLVYTCLMLSCVFKGKYPQRIILLALVSYVISWLLEEKVDFYEWN